MKNIIFFFICSAPSTTFTAAPSFYNSPSPAYIPPYTQQDSGVATTGSIASYPAPNAIAPTAYDYRPIQAPGKVYVVCDQ